MTPARIDNIADTATAVSLVGAGVSIVAEVQVYLSAIAAAVAIIAGGAAAVYHIIKIRQELRKDIEQEATDKE
jgi:hypothetical protein